MSRGGCLWKAFARTDAAAAVEFALVASVAVPLLLACIGYGVTMESVGGLQAVASQTARCIAIGSTACSNAPQYAANLAATWTGTDQVTTNDVTVTTAGSCNGLTGTFSVVTIALPVWEATLTDLLDMSNKAVAACYPTS